MLPSRAPDSPLFIGLDERTRNRRMDYAQARKVIQTAAGRVGIKKRVHAHSFRHSKATEPAKKLRETPLEAQMG